MHSGDRNKIFDGSERMHRLRNDDVRTAVNSLATPGKIQDNENKWKQRLCKMDDNKPQMREQKKSSETWTSITTIIQKRAMFTYINNTKIKRNRKTFS